MQQQHIEPEEIDLLLDGDEGFASHPLRKHLESCEECRGTLAHARQINDRLEHLPLSAPSAGFANRVMARVQVFEPWHVTLVDSVRQLVPTSRPWRVLGTAAAGGVAMSLTTAAIWIYLRRDLAVYAAQLGLTRLQDAATTTAGTAVSSMFGDSALAAVRDGGMPAIVIGLAALVATLAAATIGLRGLISAARRRGN